MNGGRRIDELRNPGHITGRRNVPKGGIEWIIIIMIQRLTQEKSTWRHTLSMRPSIERPVQLTETKIAGQAPAYLSMIGKAELASLLQVSPSTIDRRRKDGSMPSAVKFGSRVLWSTDNIQQWMKAGCPANGHNLQEEATNDVADDMK